MNNTPLERLAQRAATDPFFLGYRLAAYAQLHDLNDAALAARLGCTPELLPTIRLCRAPRMDPLSFREDVLCVAEKFGLNRQKLAEAAKPLFATPQREATPEKMLDAAGVLLAARDREDPS
jgi:hypothetical protein